MQVSSRAQNWLQITRLGVAFLLLVPFASASLYLAAAAALGPPTITSTFSNATMASKRQIPKEALVCEGEIRLHTGEVRSKTVLIR